MFDQEPAEDEDGTVPSCEAEEQVEVEDDEDDKPSDPERPDVQSGKTRDEIAMERALAKYSAELEKRE